MITARYDEVAGIVWTKASGLASVEEFDAYVPAVTQMLGFSRNRHGGGYLHLIDAADSPVQAKDAFEHMTCASVGSVSAEDRLAIVMRSSLQQRTIGSSRHESRKARAIGPLKQRSPPCVGRGVREHARKRVADIAGPACGMERTAFEQKVRLQRECGRGRNLGRIIGKNRELARTRAGVAQLSDLDQLLAERDICEPVGH